MRTTFVVGRLTARSAEIVVLGRPEDREAKCRPPRTRVPMRRRRRPSRSEGDPRAATVH